MHVVATAGHVDHGKSTLVRALTGTDPDRLEEEHRRGLSIELGYCWATLAEAGEVAFVDVPGHERFVPTMLAGAGPVPAVLLVVAADDDWMPQAAEHLAALDAFGVRHGVVAVTRADLADPEPMRQRARLETDRTGLAGAEVVAVSARTGDGLTDLQRALVRMLAGLPAPAADADVRLWVDRRFTVHGAGTVVTGTLPEGTVTVGTTLGHDDERVRVRGVQALGREVSSVSGTARVALRLGGGVPDGLDRGSVLVAPDTWHHTDVVDVRLAGDTPPPERPLLHVGAAAVGCHVRPLGARHARLTLRRPLPLRVGDRTLLRDPGAARLWGVVVLDPAPPDIRRRGAGRVRAERLARVGDQPDLADELDRRRVVEATLLQRIGVPMTDAERLALRADGWLLDRRAGSALSGRLAALVKDHTRSDPLSAGLPVAAAARALGLPSAGLVAEVLPRGLRLREGRIRPVHDAALPDAVDRAVRRLRLDLEEHPFRAPDAARLAELGLDRRAVAAAEAAGLLLRLTDSVVLMPGAESRAVELLESLARPFTVSEARRRLDSTRRVVLPLLDLLDRRGLTVRLPDDRRRLTGRAYAEQDAGNATMGRRDD